MKERKKNINLYPPSLPLNSKRIKKNKKSRHTPSP
jgi:hypothetical protein